MVIFKGRNILEVSKKFGCIIADVYENVLKEKQKDVAKDSDEWMILNDKIAREVPKIKKNTKRRVLRFLQGKEIRGLANLYCIGNRMQISNDTFFYDTILDSIDIKLTDLMPDNVIYFINRKDLTIEKVTI